MKNIWNNLRQERDTKNYLDILFENRNKTYGAYELRTNYNNRIGKALLVLLILCSISSLMANRGFKPHTKKPVRIPIIISCHFTTPPLPNHIEPKPINGTKEALPKVNPHSFTINKDKDVSNRIDPLENENLNNLTTDMGIQDGTVNTNPNDGEGPNTGTPNTNGAPNNFTFEPKEDKIFIDINVDQEPLFPGGEQALKKFLEDNLIYPGNSISDGEEGLVLVQFIVDESGNISEAKIIEKSFIDLNKEALRVVNKMPAWKPALLQGEPVKCLFEVPITFSLEK
jgi:periplasmic protein TonB